MTDLEGEVAEYIKVVERKQNEIDSLNSQLETQSNRLRDIRELNAKSEDTILELQSKWQTRTQADSLSIIIVKCQGASEGS